MTKRSLAERVALPFMSTNARIKRGRYTLSIWERAELWLSYRVLVKVKCLFNRHEVKFGSHPKCMYCGKLATR